MKILIFFIYFFQIIVKRNCQQYVPIGRCFHTATLIGTKIYFLGGATSINSVILQTTNYTNDFFYLDISNSFNKTNALPFVNLTNTSSEIPPHFAAATSVFGEPRDSIFFFGGDMGMYNDYPSKLTISFNTTTQLGWDTVTVSQGSYVPKRRVLMDAITDND